MESYKNLKFEVEQAIFRIKYVYFNCHINSNFTTSIVFWKHPKVKKNIKQKYNYSILRHLKDPQMINIKFFDVPVTKTINFMSHINDVQWD